MANLSSGLELDNEQLALANYSNEYMVTEEVEENYLWQESLIEGYCLILFGVFGLLLNTAVILMIPANQELKQWMTGFTVHGCVLDMFKSALCIPFALTLLNTKVPAHCEALGKSYVVAQTAGLFNLLAMVLAEAYTFHVHNLSESDPDTGGAFMCLLFGFSMIYVGSITIHLGPTLIGGHLSFNQDIGNCLFAYGEIHNFIVQVMWIGIVSFVYVIIYRYIYSFHSLLRANEQFRITVLARYMASMSKGKGNVESIFDVVYKMKKRVRVLFSMAVINMLCWYPLYILTLVDYKYEKPLYLYRMLTVIAWSHSVLMPLPLLVLDRSFGICNQISRVIRSYKFVRKQSLDIQKYLLNKRNKDSPTVTSKIDTKVSLTDECTANCSIVITAAEKDRESPKSVPRNSPKTLHYNGMSAYERLNAELVQVGARMPSPISPSDTLESRVIHSKETDVFS